MTTKLQKFDSISEPPHQKQVVPTSWAMGSRQADLTGGILPQNFEWRRIEVAIQRWFQTVNCNAFT